MTRYRLLFVVMVVLLAGCGGASPSDTQGENSDESPETAGAYTIDTETAGMVLGLSDLSNGYDFLSESRRSINDVQGDIRDKFENKAVIKQHSRVYTAAESPSPEKPNTITSKVIIYESPEKARQDLDAVVNQYRDSGGTVSETQLSSELTAKKIRITNQGSHSVLLYGIKDNLIYIVTTSDDSQYYTETTTNLFIKMAGNI